MNKRGGEKILSIWWFLCIALVAGAVVIGVALFYSMEVDVRPVEANVLAEKVLDCVNKNGFVDIEYVNNSELLDECDLNRNVFGLDSKLFFKLEILKGSTTLITVKRGQNQMEKDCDVASLSENYPKCALKSEKVLSYNPQSGIEELELRVLAGSSQLGRRYNSAL